MNYKGNKILFFIFMLFSPVTSLVVALLNWKKDFAKLLFLGLFFFMGMTALPEGDLASYQQNYYIITRSSFLEIWKNFIFLKDGKFFYSLFSFLFGIFFKQHNLYFGFLFFVYGFYLINLIYLVYSSTIKLSSSYFGKLLFLSFTLFFSVRYIINLAFYTGSVFILYWFIKSYLTSNTKNLFPILLAPIFHISLLYLIIPIVLFLIFRLKIHICLFILLISFYVPRSLVVEYLSIFVSDQKNNVLKEKYIYYAEDNAYERIELNYEETRKYFNNKLLFLNNFKDFLFNYLINFCLLLLLFDYRNLRSNKKYLLLYNFIIILYASSNIILNVSNGVRFRIFHLTMSLFFFLLLYQFETYNKLMRVCLSLLIPVLLLYGIMNLYASNKFISLDFYFSNFFIELFLK